VTDPNARSVVREKAALERSPLWELGRDFDFVYHPPRHVEQQAVFGEFDFSGPSGRALSRLQLGPVGRHQGANAAVAVAAIGRLEDAGIRVSESAIRQGLAEVQCPARVQVLARRPTVVFDAAHNVASAQALVDALQESFHARRRYLIFGTSRDKDAVGMLRLLLPRFDEVVLTRYVSNPRGFAPEDLLAAAREACPERGSNCRIYSTPRAAWEAVRASAAPEDLVCVTGSFFLAADLHGEIARPPRTADP
jgi:dihydrofolate synthase/folylpolyglutamate synthase